MKKHTPVQSPARPGSFPRKLLEEWRRLGLSTAGEPVIVAVSGGADSTALLLAIEELTRTNKLHLEVIVAHLDHGLRTDSKKDARFVSSLAADLGFEVVIARATLKKSAKTNLEQAARDARYKFLEKVANQTHASFVLTAHTLEDQAETVLLRLLRGSAAEGLAGITAVRLLNSKLEVRLVRPLLAWAHRRDTEEYCRLRKVDFRFDEMNDNEDFSRVRVRKQLLPLMQSFNNRIVETLNRTATLLGEDASALTVAANQLLSAAARTGIEKNKTETPALDVHTLSQAPAAVRRRALREWILRGRGDLRRLEMVHLIAVERLLNGEKGGRIAELPGGMRISRRRQLLELLPKKKLKKASATPKIPPR